MKALGPSKIEIMAAVVAAAILVVAAIFWFDQVLDVRATLEQAYGSG